MSAAGLLPDLKLPVRRELLFRLEHLEEYEAGEVDLEGGKRPYGGRICRPCEHRARRVPVFRGEILSPHASGTQQVGVGPPGPPRLCSGTRFHRADQDGSMSSSGVSVSWLLSLPSTPIP